jgi:uncharacterized repeat protein (TIGR03803 family)
MTLSPQRRDRVFDASALRATTRLAVLTFTLTIVASVAQAQTFKVLHSFKGKTDGRNPLGSVIQDGSGNLYGTAWQGGDLNCRPSFGCGIVFKLGSGNNKETILHSFAGGTDGEGPSASLLMDASGNLYGTTDTGGVGRYGTVFKINARGKLSILHSFTGGTDGAFPFSAVISDESGNLYGTTFNGGAHGYGAVFKVNPSGKLTVLHSFNRADGLSPLSGLVRDAAGNLYGTTVSGGYMGNGCGGLNGNGCGVVFKLARNGKLTLLYRFTGADDGACPVGLIRDASGTLYGVTSWIIGGELNCVSAGYGTVFKLERSSKLTTLHSFTGNADGAYPSGDVIRDAVGNLYGATVDGGNLNCDQGFGCGTVFKLDANGVLTVLHTFTGRQDGASPKAGLIGDAAGNLYGVASYGTANNGGVVFQLAP